MSEILTMETAETYFLRITKEMLKELLKPDISEEEKDLLYEKLNNLVSTCSECVPPTFAELLENLYAIVSTDEFDILKTEDIRRAIMLCEILAMPLSAETFKKMSLNQCFCIYDCDFTEDVLLEVIQDILSNSEYHGKKGYQKTELLWLDLAQMETTEKVFLELIKSANLKGDAFTEFCDNLAVSASGQERVLLALIDNIENRTLSFDKESDAFQKAQIYVAILTCAILTDSIVQKVVQIIELNDSETYYNFFHLIINEYKKKKTIVDTIVKRLNKDEEMFQKEDARLPYIRRLKMLLLNI